MITTNQTFPYIEESLTLQFSPRETASSVVSYLALNGVLPIVVSPMGAVIAKPAEYDGDMLIKWVVPQHDADGNAITQVVDGVTVPVTYTITAPWFSRDTASLDLTIPVGCTLESLGWLEPELQTIPIRWITNQGQKYFPVTHADAVIDGNGNKISSVIEWCREEVEDYGARMKSLEKKMLQTVTNYGTLSTTTGTTETAGVGYLASTLLTLYIDDELHIAADATNPDRKVTLVKEDGTVMGTYTLPLDYLLTDDAAFYIYSDSPVDDSINYSTVTMVARAGGGSNISFVESNNILTINDNDNIKTYQVAKANTFVKADGTTIKATTSADGISKTLSVSDDLQGTIYDKTTGALRHKSLTDSNATVGRNSVTFGDNTQTLNASETALGQYNTSHNNGDTDAKTTFYADADHTALSVGIGLSNTNRINAIEIMQDGTIYVKGIGNYDGKSLSTADLQSLQQVIGGSATVKCYGPFTDLNDALDTLGPADQDLLKAGIHFTVTQADGTLKEYIALKDNATEDEVIELGESVSFDIIAPEYDATSTYAVGDIVVNDGNLYKNSTAITTPEAFDAAKWTATSVASEIKDIEDAIGNLSDLATAEDGSLVDALNSALDVIAPQYDDAETYAEGDIVLNDGVLYKNTTAIDTPEAFDTTKWEPVTTASAISDIASRLDTLEGNECSADETTLTKSAANVYSVKDAGITTTQLADSAVTTAKLADAAVTSTKLAPASVLSDSVADSAITTAKLADAAITSTKLAAGSVLSNSVAESAITTSKIADSAITSAKLADASVTEDKLSGGSVTESKIATNAVTTGKIAEGAIITLKLADSAVTTAKIKDAAITADKLAADSVTTTAILDGAITEDKLDPDIKDAINNAGAADGTTLIKDSTSNTMSVKDAGITSAKLADGSVTSTKIAAGAVVTDSIADAAITSAKLATASVLSDSVADSAITTAKLADAAITSTKLAAGSVLSNSVAESAITTSKIADSAITTAKLADASVTEAKLADASITEAKLATDAVTTAKIKDAAITSDKLAAGSVLTDSVGDQAITAAKLANDAKVGSLSITNETTGSKLDIKDAAGTSLASATLTSATTTNFGVVKVDDALSDTSTNPVQNKVVDAAIKALDLSSTGGTDKIITTISQSDGLVSATSVAAVTKETTPTTGSAYTYTIAGSTTKVEFPDASTTVKGVITLDEQIVEDATGKVTSTNTPTSKALGDYLAEKLGDLAGAMTYEGVIDSTHSLPTTYPQGATYVCAEDGTYAGYALNIGHMLIANGDSDKGGTWTAVKPTPKVDNKDVTLTAGTKATIATVDGRDITLTPQTIDSTLSDTSENSVQNKVITPLIDHISRTGDDVTLAPEGSLIISPNEGITIKSQSDCDINISKNDDTSLINIDTEDGIITINGASTNVTSLDFTYHDSIVATYDDFAAIAPLYDSASTYALGDIIVSDGKLYKNSTAITTPEAFDAAKWTEINVISEVNSIATSLGEIDTVKASINALDLTAVGGTDKIITTVSQTDGLVSATSVDAVTKDTTPTTGYLATYTIAGSSTKVDIPYDTTVVAAEQKVCTTADTPATGLHKDEYYLDLTINDKGKTQTATHLYVPTGRYTDIDLTASVFSATPALPSGYTLTDLAQRSLYVIVNGSRLPVFLNATAKVFYYTIFDGTNLQVVSSDGF